MFKQLFILVLLSIMSNSCDFINKGPKNFDSEIDQDSILVILEQIKESNLPVENHLDQLDEVYSQLGQVSVDTLKIQYLSQLSLITSKIVDSQLFQNVNRDFEKLAGELQDSVKLAEAFWDKGAYFDLPDIAQRDSAYLYFSKAQKIFQQLEDDISSSSVLRAMASVQTDVHDNTGAIVNATEAIRLLKPYDEYKKLYYAYNTMGIAYAALKEYDQALEYYNLAEEQLQKLKSESIELASLKNNIGYLYSNKGDFLNAKKEFQEAISTDSLLWYKPDLYAKLLDHLAITNFKLGIMDSVEENLYRSQFIRDSIGDLEGLSLNYYNLALVNKEIGRKADAFIFAGNARDLAKEIDNNLRYLESLRLLSELDPENSGYYLNEYSEMSENLLQEERRIRNKFANIKFETEETENRNRQLARQQLIWIGIAVGLLLFAIALSIIVVQRIKNQRLKFQQQQQEANQEIFNLMLAQKQKVEEGKQSEQKRISEELHDGILGEMNGVRMVLLGLNKKGDDAAVALREQAIEKLKEVQEEIRSISHELNDASYQKFNNFMNSIEDLLKNTVEPAGIQYHFSYDQDLDWDQLEGVTKINLYRILQESLQNCIKHAAATSIYVSFEVDGYQIVITIQDNGRGFETGKGKKGIGHKNIESRVRKIRGKWYLKSAPGIGTTVLLEIPMEHISQEAKKEISLPKDLQEV